MCRDAAREAVGRGRKGFRGTVGCPQGGKPSMERRGVSDVALGG